MSANTEHNLAKKPTNFIRAIIDQDLSSGKHSRIVTRFPPEPNGYLHIGHAKSICLNFGLAEDYQGACHLRFDDTNPEKESQEYIDAICADVQWLGYQWHGDIRYASDYFEQIYQFALALIRKGLAYVCSLSADEATQYRGTLTAPGINSPYRERSVEENLDLFERMRQGEFPDGAHALRAKIDMASPNMNLRDPLLYRIRHQPHHQTGDRWCIYPLYDFTHPISDALEGITHSLCTLEFEDHRPLYDWVIANTSVPCMPRQIEFARLNMNYTVTSKRKLKRLVDEGFVEGWNDPRMPTISGMRRRGFTPLAIRNFCDAVGINRAGGTVDVGMLEHAIREDLNERAPRAMCVLRPLKVVLTNYAADQTEMLSLPIHPQKPELGTRNVPWTAALWIDQEDFSQTPPPKWKRLAPGQSVRLRGGYVITCREVICDAQGEPVQLNCEVDLATLGTNPQGYKPNGVIHWVSAAQALDVEIRLYDRLFLEARGKAGENDKSPYTDKDDKDGDFTDLINPESLTVIRGAKAEPGLATAATDLPFQFEREGYFFKDDVASAQQGLPVFNRTVTLRDSWRAEF